METAERPAARRGAPDDALGGGTTSKITGRGYRPRVCDRCRKPLPPRRRRFCSDPCRIRQQKAERVIEDADYAAGVKRLVRAQGKRAGADLVMFAMFAEAVDYARARLQDSADQLIAQGYSYGDIGRALGISRQGARQRFARQQEVVTETAGTGAA
jgi:hypothetical protein